ncbi:MAG: hypothetical protein L6R37_001408 [Teloschistes peruensis]|nr:MAG: hypothetical protein L6R37_001408 [Teloschistes peruensis]
MAPPTESIGANITHTVQHTGQRLKHFLKPDGRRVHIAASPEEKLKIHRNLLAIEPHGNFDVCLHGSPEHLEAVRAIHAHHEQKRGELREKHSSIYEEFEHVHLQLEALSKEMHHLTEHGVSLDANFSKFGYDAHLRTRDPDSTASSISRSSSDNGQRDWAAERTQGRSLKVWKRPVVRQYLHKGLIWRSAELQEVASFELFVDLLYVGIIAIIGDSAAEEPTSYGLLKFIIVFSLGWKIWSDVQMVTSWLETDDIFQRFCVMFVLVCLFGYTLNIVEAFETTYAMMISFYLTQRLFLAAYLLWISYLIPMIRGFMVSQVAVATVGCAIWIWVAMFLDIVGQGFVVLAVRRAQKMKNRAGPLIQKWFEFQPSLNIEHRTERTNAFVTLVFGYSVVSLLYQNRAAYGINAFFGKAILGLVQAFFFNWLYFEIDGWNIHTHAIRRHVASSILWIFIHLPFIMAYVLAGASLSRLVLAHDCKDADSETLEEASLGRSEAEIEPGLRWFYCVGLGIALLCMSVISFCHVHKKFDGQRVTKRSRLGLRVAVAVVITCLPLAESLNSLQLVSTTTGLIGLVLGFDLYGCTYVGESFLRDGRKCKYWADCPRKRRRALEEAMKTGEVVNVEELAVDEKGYVPAP